MKRLFSLLLVLVTLVTCFPTAALAVTAEEAEELVLEAPVQEEVTATPAVVSDETAPAVPIKEKHANASSDYPDNDELFAGYTESVFYGGSATYNKATGKLQTSNSAMYANAAGKRLSGDEKRMYTALVSVIKKIAAGSRSSTTITVGEAGYYGGSYLTPDVSTSLLQYDFDLNILHDALLADLPYEQYWYDKTTGVSVSGWYSSDGTLGYLIFKFTVAKTYRRYSYDPLYADTSKTSAATTAAANARKIVSSNKSKSDYQKLVAYKDAICDRVTYDFDAVNYGDFSVNNNPWQMIYAFDNDPSTNIVCEGYSKAFMYLCDQTDFSGDVTCYTVTGDAGGPHMWNVVTIGGKNYLVDITNSDDGSIGQNGGLFLAGGSGSAYYGYSLMGGRMYFEYDYDTMNLWGTGSSSILTLSSTDYTPPAAVKITTNIKNKCVAEGETAKVTITAKGDGLKYEWYYKNPGDSKFTKTTKFTGRTYSMTMSAKYSGRQVYCKITDKYGNTVKSKTVSLDQKATITTNIRNKCVAAGKTAKVTVTAVGKNLTYTWYYKNPGMTKFAKTTKFTGRSYSMTMSAKYSGRQVYCVIEDAYGNTVKTKTVSLNQKATITNQPAKTITVAKGSTKKITITAVGKDLTYTWYYKNPGDSKFTKSPKFSGKTYSMTMVKKYSGRQVYCVVKDSFGNTVKSNVFTFKMK